jgi:general secretion pathway protein A
MYKSWFGLRESPFGVTPDLRFVYLSRLHREALAGMTYGILSRKRFIILSGDVGTGKTTLVKTAVRHLPGSLTRVGLITNSTLTAREVLESTLWSFGLTEIPPSKVERLGLLEELLQTDVRQGRTSTLIVDEAHKLGYQALEEIRLLGNFDSLQIVLAGQSELVETLDRDELRAFKQRIALRLCQAPLSVPDVEQYVSYRWKTAGGKLPAPFDKQALLRIAHESRGIPRLINVLCDTALITAFQDRRYVATGKDILEASGELHLRTLAKAPEMAVAPVQEPVRTDVPNGRAGILGRVFRMTRSGDHTDLASSKAKV